ncbi:hypothetical protein [Tenggerimyces flavus]|uniref:Uncharacterized protein n=1 Tax=Tenggerimyces flavus TaxID=1708749 RepID=A0ABV7YMJ2_9ACTN|nr:hypothetical protein [Tenggerimyces flavus]MBM7786355.1 hypothetical protein [Tenggerimyces flavus]
MRRVALAVAAFAAVFASSGCGAVGWATQVADQPAAAEASPQVPDGAESLQQAADKLSAGDHAWAGANKARIVSVYADLVNNRVKVLVSAGTNANAVTVAAKKATGLAPVVEAAPQRAASKPQTPAPCSCLPK